MERRNQIDGTVVFPTMSPNEPNLALRGVPGRLRPWIVVAIVAAALATVAMVGVGGQLLYGQLDLAHSRGQWWLRSGVTSLVVAMIALALVLPARSSRFIRVATVLPLAHAAAIAIGWTLWSHVATHVTIDARSPLASALPLGQLVLVTSLVFALVAQLAARRRTGEWVHGFAVLALTELLLVGLWMPIVAAGWSASEPPFWEDMPAPVQTSFVMDLGTLVPYVVVPPTLAAIAYTVAVLRNPRWLAARKRIAINTVVTLFGLACLARLTADDDSMLLYAHFIPVLLVAAVVVIVALAALALVLAVRAIVARRKLHTLETIRGVVTADGNELVLGLEIASWLRGPRVVQRSFSIATSHGIIPVSGANLVTGTPAASTLLEVGEALGVVRPGDTVEIAGHIATPAAEPSSGDPFRTHAGPSADVLWVAPVRGERGGLALALWRPCVAYLVIVTAIALPALAALLG